MKLATLTILMLCITFSIVIFDSAGTIDPESAELDFYGISDDISTNKTTTKIWDFMLDPTGWSKEDSIIRYIIIAIGGLLVIGAAVALVAKSYAPDIYVFGIFYLGLLGFGAIPVILLFDFIQTRFSALMCDPGYFCFFPTVIASLIAGSLGIIWIVKVINSWRTAQE